MPVYCVRVNNYSRHGLLRASPEVMGVTAQHRNAAAAIAWMLDDQWIRPRDVEVDTLSERDDCWFQPGPEEMQ